MNDKRRNPRSRVMLGGRIVVDGCSTFDCRIRDLSNTGARIEIENTVGIPDKFDLTISNGRGRFSARVVRRTDRVLAVVLEHPTGTVVSFDAALQIRRTGLVTDRMLQQIAEISST